MMIQKRSLMQKTKVELWKFKKVNMTGHVVPILLLHVTGVCALSLSVSVLNSPDNGDEHVETVHFSFAVTTTAAASSTYASCFHT